MLVPVRLSDSQNITRRFERWEIRFLVCRTLYDEEYVDDRLRRKFWY